MFGLCYYRLMPIAHSGHRYLFKHIIAINYKDTLYASLPSSLTCQTFRFNSSKKIDKSRVPQLKESELEEEFVHGWGAGGSKVNTDLNCVVLKHIPTGIVVKCHEQRRKEDNRKIARQRLIDKLDEFINKENSVAAQKKRLFLEKERKADAKAAKQREKKARFKAMLEKLEGGDQTKET